jgi:hypothetical protein
VQLELVVRLSLHAGLRQAVDNVSNQVNDARNLLKTGLKNS